MKREVLAQVHDIKRNHATENWRLSLDLFDTRPDDDLFFHLLVAKKAVIKFEVEIVATESEGATGKATSSRRKPGGTLAGADGPAEEVR